MDPDPGGPKTRNTALNQVPEPDSYLVRSVIVWLQGSRSKIIYNGLNNFFLFRTLNLVSNFPLKLLERQEPDLEPILKIVDYRVQIQYPEIWTMFHNKM